MAYAIFRTAKYKATQKITSLMVHHLREKPEKVDGADPSRSHLNVIIGAANRRAFFKAVRDRISTCTRKPRPDANRVVELIVTASPAFFEGKSYEEQKNYLLDCVEFAKQKFGPENIVGAYLHFDESSPHAHILCVPLETSVRTTKKLTRTATTLNAGHYMGGTEKMIKWQDEFALFVQGRGHDLLRGEPKAETHRDHVPVAQYWKDKKREADAAQVAAVDLLTTAASEAKQAATLRRDAQRVQQCALTTLDDAELDRQECLRAHQCMTTMQAEVEEQRSKVRLDRIAVDAEWTRARESRAAAARIETDAERRVLALAEQARQLERAHEQAKEARAQADLAAETCDREADALRKGMAGLGNVEEVRKLVRKPELVAMFEFVDKCPTAKTLLNLLKADPLVGDAVALTIAGFVGGGDGDATTWESPQAVAAARFLDSVRQPYGESNNPNFGM